MLRLFKGMKNIITPAYYASRKHSEKQSSHNGPTVNPVLRKMQTIPCGIFAPHINKQDKFIYQVEDENFSRFWKDVPSLDRGILSSTRFEQIKPSATGDDTDEWFSEVRMKSKSCRSKGSQSISTDKNKIDRCEDIYQSQCVSKVDNTDVILQIHSLTKRRKSLRGMVKQITIFSLYPNKMQNKLPLPVESPNLFATGFLKPIKKVSIIHSIPLNTFGVVRIADQMPKVKMKENNACLVDDNLLLYLQIYNRRPCAPLGVGFHDKDHYESLNNYTNVYSIEHRSMGIKDQMKNEKKLERKHVDLLRYLQDGSPRTPLDVDFYSDELPYELPNNTYQSIEFLDTENPLINNKIKLERKDDYSDECPRTPLDVDCYNEDIHGLQNTPTSVNFIEQVFMGLKVISGMLPLKIKR
ncbi:uncharacterized protein LOC119686248 [Teleopsis dalmanni]|uniref:uncharacterized protein LOC119686248 n=1 Tax=Teleopsis dalmanni TaxID=139649 RepID=UPI0018CECD4C|nr:uncharacterized protein LOC119686248 [Teleopsis dalmanni]